MTSSLGTFGVGLVAQAVSVAGAAGNTASDQPDSRTVHRLTLLLAATLIVVVVVMLGLILLRSMRRWRERVLRERPRPTPTTDVWSMHRLPENAGGDENTDGNAAEDGDDRPR